ncbi:MAG: hypothetical protein ACRCSK_03390 [Fusobacteriaceae bacterium]
MEVDNVEYIFYNEKNSCVKLSDFKNYIVNINQKKNKHKIIKCFIKKMKNDYIKPSNILLKKESKYFYTVTLLLSSFIDVLAKYYMGNTDPKKIGKTYKAFLIKKIPDLDCFYSDVRCEIVHQNSTKILLTTEDSDQHFYSKGNRKVINLGALSKKFDEMLEIYEKELIENDRLFKKFSKILKVVYID